MLSSDMIPMVRDVVNREGQIVTLSLIDDTGVYNPDTSEVVLDDPVEHTTKAIFLDFAILANGLQTKGGGTIEMNDKQVYLLPIDTTTKEVFSRKPSPAGDTITDVNGKVWRIVLIKEYNPSGSNTIMYDMLVRA